MVNIMNINKYIKINFSFIIFLLVSLFSGLILKSTLFIICLIVHEIGHILLIKFFNQNLNKLIIVVINAEYYMKNYVVEIMQIKNNKIKISYYLFKYL